MRIAIFDPSAGVSGDMTLGALLSLGVPASWLEQLPARLGLAGVGVTIRDTSRCGVAAKQVEFSIPPQPRSEEHTSELQSRPHLVCRLLLEKKKNYTAECTT